MRYVPICLAAAVLAIGPASADKLSPLVLRETPQIDTVELRVPIKPSGPQERKKILDIPATEVDLAVPHLWSNPVRRISVNYPPSALAVERTRTAVPQACPEFFDRVYLRTVRLNGFRLVGYEAVPLTPRPAHTLQKPLEAIATKLGSPDLSTMDLPAADQIRIRPPLYVMQEGSNQRCWSGYRLTITLEGPVGGDPFKRIRPSNRPQIQTRGE